MEKLCKVTVSSVVGCFAMMVIAMAIEHISNIVLVKLVLKLIICAMTYFTICFMMKNQIVLEYWELFKRKINR